MNILFEKTASFLIILLLGAALRHTGILRPEDKRLLSFMCMNVTLPAAIIVSFSGAEISIKWLAVAAVGFLLNWISIGLGWLLSIGRAKQSCAAWCLGFTGYNLGSFLIPMAQQMLSPSMVSLICIFDFGNGLMTLGDNNAAVSAIISDGRGFDLRAFGRTLLRAPALVTEALMIILTLSGVRMPQSLVNVLSPIAEANFFLPILLVGVMLDVKLPRDKLRHVMQLVAVRTAMTVVTAAVLWLCLPMDEQARAAIVLCCCAPISVMSSLYISNCGADESVSSMAYSIYVFISIPLIFAAMSILGL